MIHYVRVSKTDFQQIERKKLYKITDSELFTYNYGDTVYINEYDGRTGKLTGQEFESTVIEITTVQQFDNKDVSKVVVLVSEKEKGRK